MWLQGSLKVFTTTGDQNNGLNKAWLFFPGTGSAEPFLVKTSPWETEI